MLSRMTEPSGVMRCGQFFSVNSRASRSRRSVLLSWHDVKHVMNTSAHDAKTIFFKACASWSGHDVRFIPQGMPSSFLMTSSAFCPRTSELTPIVLPGHPPTNSTLFTTCVSSSTSRMMRFEQVPCGSYSYFIARRYFMLV